MKIKTLISSLALAAICTTPVVAGKATGLVKIIYTQGDLIFVKIASYDPEAGTFPNSAGTCPAIFNGEMSIDGSTSAGKNLYAMLLTARSLGAEVSFTGTGTCTLNGAREDVSYGTITGG